MIFHMNGDESNYSQKDIYAEVYGDTEFDKGGWPTNLGNSVSDNSKTIAIGGAIGSKMLFSVGFGVSRYEQIC